MSYLRKNHQMAAAPPRSNAAAAVPLEPRKEPTLGIDATWSAVGEFVDAPETKVAPPTTTKYPTATHAAIFIT